MYYTDYDDSTLTIKNKIRRGETMKYNYILIIGNRESKNKTVNLREEGKQIEYTLSDFMKICK